MYNILDIEKRILNIEYGDIIDFKLVIIQNFRFARQQEEETQAAIRKEQIRREEERKDFRNRELIHNVQA